MKQSINKITISSQNELVDLPENYDNLTIIKIKDTSTPIFIKKDYKNAIFHIDTAEPVYIYENNVATFPETPTAKARWVLNYSNFLYRPKSIYTSLFH